MILHIALKIALKHTLNTEYVYKKDYSKQKILTVSMKSLMKIMGYNLKSTKHYGSKWQKVAIHSNHTSVFLNIHQ